uniref:Reverse transcriptase Ty1/copia-type domain-containing protein n=1 Tax=Vitis vinifera TaxID=29760 RepID=A5ARM7_VITVI|nr:hypothetical protein VITISV_009567 [Vitis vinifera]
MLCTGLNVVGFNWIASPTAIELESIVMDWVGKMLMLPPSFLFSGGGGGVLNGVELSHSISMNPHKWLLTNMDCCCLWIKEPHLFVDSLSTAPEYLRNNASKSKMVIDYKDWQIALSRRFRAIKVWVVIRRHGLHNLMFHICNDVKLAKRFVAHAAKDPIFEVVVPRRFALAIGAALGIATHSMVVGKGIVLALFQALKRRCLRRFCRPPYRCSDAVQGPSDTGEGCRFKRASGAIQGSPQPPFRHHSSTIGGTNCSTVQALIAAPFRRHLQHCSQRHFRRHARRTPCVIQAPLFSVRSGIVLPPFWYCVGATDSHRYSAILTLILVIERGAMASFGGILLPAASFEDGSGTADDVAASVHWCRFRMPFWLSNTFIDYKETFSPVSSKDSFRIIMALVAQYDLELHQMDVKTAFLNGNINEIIYMVQPENFESNDSKQLVCKLKETRLWQKVINLVCTNVRKMNLRGRIWLQNFITQLRIADGIKKPLRINCDNKAAELYSKNNRSSSKSKHIDIKFLVVKKRV